MIGYYFNILLRLTLYVLKKQNSTKFKDLIGFIKQLSWGRIPSAKCWEGQLKEMHQMKGF